MKVDTPLRHTAPRPKSAGALHVELSAVDSAALRVDVPAKTVSGIRVWLSAFVDRLGPQEFRRRLIHIAPGILPLILLPVPHRDPLSPTLMGIMIALTFVISAYALLTHRTFVRRGEKSLLWAVAGYAGVVLSMLVMMPSAPELGLAVMAIIAFGDGSATLVGLLARGRSLPWNPAKSWAGTAAFVLASAPLATLVYWGEAQPGVPVATAFACAASAALVAAVAESLPSRINDNIRVGVAAAVTICIAHAMFVGW